MNSSQHHDRPPATLAEILLALFLPVGALLIIVIILGLVAEGSFGICAAGALIIASAVFALALCAKQDRPELAGSSQVPSASTISRILLKTDSRAIRFLGWLLFVPLAPALLILSVLLMQAHCVPGVFATDDAYTRGNCLAGRFRSVGSGTFTVTQSDQPNLVNQKWSATSAPGEGNADGGLIFEDNGHHESSPGQILMNIDVPSIRFTGPAISLTGYITTDGYVAELADETHFRWKPVERMQSRPIHLKIHSNEWRRSVASWLCYCDLLALISLALLALGYRRAMIRLSSPA
jgi:hypothetical protein